MSELGILERLAMGVGLRPLMRLNRRERRARAAGARGKGGFGWREKKQRIGDGRRVP